MVVDELNDVIMRACVLHNVCIIGDDANLKDQDALPEEDDPCADPEIVEVSEVQGCLHFHLNEIGRKDFYFRCFSLPHPLDTI